MVASPTRPAPVSADPDLRRAPAGRPLSQRRGLPGARAVIGGLLVVIAVVGTFVAYQQATAPNTASYVVAAHAIAPGAHIQASDLTTRRVNLPAAMRGHAYTNPAVLKGAVTLGPIGNGELVQRSLVTSGSDATRNLVSFAVSPQHAVAGNLSPGDHIAVLVSSAQGNTPRVVASNLQVVSVKSTSGGLSGGPQLVITVSADANQAVGVAAATNPDNVMVVRTTGAPPSDIPSVETPSSGSSGNSS